MDDEVIRKAYFQLCGIIKDITWAHEKKYITTKRLVSVMRERRISQVCQELIDALDEE